MSISSISSSPVRVPVKAEQSAVDRIYDNDKDDKRATPAKTAAAPAGMGKILDKQA